MIPPLSSITIKWEDNATFEQKLERIITQKWIAMYPEGEEAWAEFRRTGYPKLYPAAPVELFCEVSNYVREHSPFAYTFYFGYTNGWFGYLPTALSWTRGGYEPRTSPFTPEAAEDLEHAVLGYLQGEMRKTYKLPKPTY